MAPNATVLQMMQKIHNKKGIPIHEMQLTYNNRQLEEDKSLAYYGINNGATVVLKVVLISILVLLQLFSSLTVFSYVNSPTGTRSKFEWTDGGLSEFNLTVYLLWIYMFVKTNAEPQREAIQSIFRSGYGLG